MWGFTPDESIPYIEQRGRDMLFREAIIKFLGADTKKKGTSGHHKKHLGQYCQGKDIQECRGYFGDFLINVCATCPQ
jgi:hypothetical protein